MDIETLSLAKKYADEKAGNIPDGTITEDKLDADLKAKVNSQIPPSEIADGAVSTSKLANKAVTPDKLSADLQETVSDLDKVYYKEVGSNLCNPNAIVDGLIDSTGKVSTSTANRQTSDFIEIDPTSSYSFTTWDGNTRTNTKKYYAFYDSNKTFISPRVGPVNAGEGISGSIPSSAKYIRVSTDTGKAMYVRKGSTPTTYSAYTETYKTDLLATNVVTDKTLSVTGKAADAKAVGDALAAANRDTVISEMKVRQQALSDITLKSDTTSRAFVKNVTAGTSRSTQSTIYNELLSGVYAMLNRHKAKNGNIIRFSFITDIHIGGTRTSGYNPQYNISAYIALSNAKCDFAVNGGDMITNYYDATNMTGLPMALDTEDQVHDLFGGLTIPYYPVKGNHDIGVNGFSKITTPDVWNNNLYGIDPETGAIYKITEEAFADYLAGGGDFYTLSGYEYFTNQEIQEVALDGYCTGATFNVSDQYGWYYYKDFGDKLRLIVLNDFYNTGETTGGSTRSPSEAAWLEAVLDDALANELAVITISHTAQGLTNGSVRAKIDAFTSGGGVYVGHIHGHEHCDVYTNAYGNNIGVDASLISSTSTLDYGGYSFSVFEVDLDNKLLYETRVGRFDDCGSDAHGNSLYRSEDRVYSFDTHKLLT